MGPRPCSGWRCRAGENPYARRKPVDAGDDPACESGGLEGSACELGEACSSPGELARTSSRSTMLRLMPSRRLLAALATPSQWQRR